jgi:hypothetical protein
VKEVRIPRLLPEAEAFPEGQNGQTPRPDRTQTRQAGTARDGDNDVDEAHRSWYRCRVAPPDVLDLKNQVAVAFVESIFRRAGYSLTVFRSHEIPPHLGREDLPDFIAVPPITREQLGPRPVKVRYRRHLGQYLTVEAQRGVRSFLALAKQHWPGLVVVFVADEPEPGHSCFRVLDLATWSPADAPALVDLFVHPSLNIYQLNVEEHEALARRILALLSMRRAHSAEESTGYA